jgi:hypothetical protein
MLTTRKVPICRQMSEDVPGRPKMSARAVPTLRIQGPNHQCWRAFRPSADTLSTFCAWSVCLLSFVAGWHGGRDSGGVVDVGRRGEAASIHRQTLFDFYGVVRGSWTSENN